jgi:antitoxin HicB
MPRSRSYSVYYEEAPEGGYVATVPALPGCHTQGETLEKAGLNIADAITLYVESLSAHGEAIPEEAHHFRAGLPSLPEHVLLSLADRPPRGVR